jgi:plasmid stabilization system protein ParE
VRGILTKADLLRQLPYLGAVYREGKDPSVRVLLHGHYRIFYRIGDDEIRVSGVYHERMDVRHLRFD